MPLSLLTPDLASLDPPSKIPTGVIKTAVETLGGQIVRGEYPPDTTLPFEPELSALLSVGRNALREAIKVLTGKGLVRTARRYGTKVCPPAEWNMLDADILRWLTIDSPLVRRFMFDLIETRRHLEPLAAELAATRASDDEIAELIATARLLGGEDIDMVVKADVLFHVKLIHAAHNSVLSQLGQAIGALLRIYFRIGVAEARSYTPNPEKHLAVAEAIAARDPARARADMLALLQSNKEEAEQLTGERIGR